MKGFIIMNEIKGLLIKPNELNKAFISSLDKDELQNTFKKSFVAELHIYDDKKYRVYYNNCDSIMEVSCFSLLEKSVLTFGDILILGENGESLEKSDFDYLFEACFQIDNIKNEKRFALEIFSFSGIEKKHLNDYITMIYRVM